MGRIIRRFLEDQFIFCCCACDFHVTALERVASCGFVGKHGPAVLVHSVVNIVESEQEQFLKLSSGEYIVREIECISCKKYMGFRYIHSFTPECTYKINMYLLERSSVEMKSNEFFDGHEHVD